MKTFIISLILTLYTSIVFAEVCPKFKYGDTVKFLGFYEKLGEGIVVNSYPRCLFRVERIFYIDGLPFVEYITITGYDLESSNVNN